MKNPWKQYSKINPQREEGNRQISSCVLQALMKAELTGTEFRIVMVIIDKTWGFNKNSEFIPNRYFVSATGLSEREIWRSIKSLKQKRLIHYALGRPVQSCAPLTNRSVTNRSVTNRSPLNEYLFNKHYDTWKAEGIKTRKSSTIPLTYLSPPPLTNRSPPSFIENNIIERKEYDPSGSLSGKPDAADEKIPFSEIIDHLNAATHKNFKSENKTTKAHIRARWSQGFRVEDFKIVIDKKTEKWGHNPKMVDYLRPETLFGSKFESYLNETASMVNLVSETTRQNMKNLDAWEKMHEEQERIQAADEPAR